MAVWGLILGFYALVVGFCSGGVAGLSGGGVVGGEVLEFSVGPERVACVGAAPMECLVVDGELFYEEIEGFEFESGYRYRVEVERYERWPGREPPQDAGRYGYRLVRVLERVRVP